MLIFFTVISHFASAFRGTSSQTHGALSMEPSGASGPETYMARPPFLEIPYSPPAMDCLLCKVVGTSMNSFSLSVLTVDPSCVGWVDRLAGEASPPLYNGSLRVSSPGKLWN